ncbi:MAG TPA: enoyl-CoA hydratase/isomerase family protein [Candidatus Caldiarchaeum subterraneum]|uniref:Enoyl-CoA hydratase/isomerase family protein n=1 Tax=Caldiarchaeum subterraneum TaxID=311458 RepID=A0A833ECC5_CALS0|nr:enoyl-CoA hydratase/isomerase family protein [Aigarchaeota archaeon]HIQ30124.1 enoyl-CoA hydratase/isomerase family protein [Candidatus Caldarchaeum subterraneum]
MAEREYIKYEVRDGVAYITLNRPERRNAMNKQLRRQLLQALKRSEEDENVHVIVLQGAEGNFCAGQDLEELYEMTGLEIRRYHREQGTQLITAYIREMTKIVIAAVDGYCVGGGCELIQGCDIVIATSRARFGQPEVRVGLVPGGGATQRMPRQIGFRRALELMLTGRLFPAEEAYQMGLVNYVVEPEKLQEKIEEVTSDLKAKSRIILALIKRAVNASLETPLSAGLEFERELHFYTWLTEDRLEGIKAFLEKRKPIFKGK